MPGRGWEDREIDIVAGDDIFHHRAGGNVFHRKILGPGFDRLQYLRDFIDDYQVAQCAFEAHRQSERRGIHHRTGLNTEPLLVALEILEEQGWAAALRVQIGDAAELEPELGAFDLFELSDRLCLLQPTPQVENPGRN